MVALFPVILITTLAFFTVPSTHCRGALASHCYAAAFGNRAASDSLSESELDFIKMNDGVSHPERLETYFAITLKK